MKKILLVLLLSLPFATTTFGAHPTDKEPTSNSDSEKGERSKKHHDHQKMKRAHIKHRISQTDSNGDGKVSREEYLAAAEQRFTQMDLNADGEIEPEEMKQAHSNMREKHFKARQEARKAYKEELEESTK